MNKKFWNWVKPIKNEEGDQASNRVLEINGTIAEDSWFDDDVTPEMFKAELFSEKGDVDVWINSVGGDCIAASRIYTMLIDYPGFVTIKIDGLAASAASVISMAGDKVYMSPTSLMMVHNPLTTAYGNSAEMQKAIEMLAEVKESIINAYEKKTGLSRAKISHMMDEETWMNANKAVELGFADGVLESSKLGGKDISFAYSNAMQNEKLMQKIANKIRAEMKEVEPEETKEQHGRKVEDLMNRLNLIRY